MGGFLSTPTNTTEEKEYEVSGSISNIAGTSSPPPNGESGNVNAGGSSGSNGNRRKRSF